MKIRRKFHTAKLLIAAVGLFLDGVSQEGRGNKRLDADDFILIVDGSLDPELSHRIRENVPPLSTAFVAFEPHQVLCRHGSLEKTVRVEPDLELPNLRSGRLRIHSSPGQGPRVVTVEQIDLRLFYMDGNSDAAAARIISL